MRLRTESNDNTSRIINNATPASGWAIWGVTTLLAGTALIGSGFRNVKNELKGVFSGQ